jgi:hypothetical protein
MFSDLKYIDPEDGAISPESILISVDFPAPLVPMTA